MRIGIWLIGVTLLTLQICLLRHVESNLGVFIGYLCFWATFYLFADWQDWVKGK